MIDNYDNQTDKKLQQYILVKDWRAKRNRLGRAPSESGFSLKSAESVNSYVSSGNTLTERKRLVEERKLEMQALNKNKNCSMK